MIPKLVLLIMSHRSSKDLCQGSMWGTPDSNSYYIRQVQKGHQACWFGTLSPLLNSPQELLAHGGNYQNPIGSVAVREGPAVVKSRPHWRQQRIQRAGRDGEVLRSPDTPQILQKESRKRPMNDDNESYQGPKQHFFRSFALKTLYNFVHLRKKT